MILVVDASVAVKWYLEEEYSDIAEKLLYGEFNLHAPELIFAELGNVLWKKCRAGDVNSDDSLSIIKNFLNRDIIFHNLDKLLVPAWIGANSFGHAVYDWIYLVLAKSLNAKLVTADRRFYMSLRRTNYKNDIMWIEGL